MLLEFLQLRLSVLPKRYDQHTCSLISVALYFCQGCSPRVSIKTWTVLYRKQWIADRLSKRRNFWRQNLYCFLVLVYRLAHLDMECGLPLLFESLFIDCYWFIFVASPLNFQLAFYSWISRHQACRMLTGRVLLYVPTALCAFGYFCLHRIQKSRYTAGVKCFQCRGRGAVWKLLLLFCVVSHPE